MALVHRLESKKYYSTDDFKGSICQGLSMRSIRTYIGFSGVAHSHSALQRLGEALLEHTAGVVALGGIVPGHPRRSVAHDAVPVLRRNAALYRLQMLHGIRSTASDSIHSGHNTENSHTS